MTMNDTIISTLNASDDMIFRLDVIKQIILILPMLLKISSNLKLAYSGGNYIGTLVSAVLFEKKLLYNIKQ